MGKSGIDFDRLFGEIQPKSTEPPRNLPHLILQISRSRGHPKR